MDPLNASKLISNCKFCNNAWRQVKILSLIYQKGDIGSTYKPEEPNDLVQIDFGALSTL